jgi:uncharacterized delta-60 repeat protein
VGGVRSNSNAEEGFAVVRCNADGTVDSGFGTNGIATGTLIYLDVAQVGDIAVQADGAILVAGNAEVNLNDEFKVVRFTSAGALDATFGVGGSAVGVFGGYAIGQSVAIQPDGKILVGGGRNNSGVFLFSVVRFNANGSLDTGFGGGGLAEMGGAQGSEMLLQPDGKILVCGTAGSFIDYDFGVTRFNSDGTLDEAFGGGDGIASQNVGTQVYYNDFAYSMALQADGRIVVGGWTTANFSDDYGLVRFNSDGSLDTSFGTNARSPMRAPGMIRSRASPFNQTV